MIFEHQHPISGQTVRGIRLVLGACVHFTDLIRSASGRWEDSLKRGVLCNQAVYCIRPTKLTRSQIKILKKLSATDDKGRLVFTSIKSVAGNYEFVPGPGFRWDFDEVAVEQNEDIQSLCDYGYLCPVFWKSRMRKGNFVLTRAGEEALAECLGVK